MGGWPALADSHARRATPVGTARIGARAWFGALDLPWGTEVLSASAAVEQHVDVAREAWSRPALGNLRPLRGSTPLLVETRAPRTVWVAGWGLVPWSLTSPVVGWAALLEWGRIRGRGWGAEVEGGGDRSSAWERAHDRARWELAIDVFACESSGQVRSAGSFLCCIAAEGGPIRVDDLVLFDRRPLPSPYDGIGLASALLAAVSAVHDGGASLLRTGRSGMARRFEVVPRRAGNAHPEERAKHPR